MSTANFADFVQAQNPIYSQVVSELTQGHKRSHWMWFIFPQIQGLGFSAMAQCFALDSLKQAQDYLQHEILGPRLLQCAELLLAHTDKTALEIFGRPDNLKLHSSLTLFALAAKETTVFEQLLQQFYAGEYDQQTLAILDW
jgi:uncharacterized protein (DUF1810 family)